MSISYRGRWILLGLALAALVTGFPFGCGSEQSKLDRGLVVDQEQAVPESNKDLNETEAQRRAREEREVEKKEAKEIDQAQQ
jgi:hypothetical protein